MNEHDIVKDLLSLHTKSIAEITQLTSDIKLVTNNINQIIKKINSIENNQINFKKEIDSLITIQQTLHLDVKSLLADFRQKFDTTLQFLSTADFTKEMIEKIENKELSKSLLDQNTTIDKVTLLLTNIETTFKQISFRIKVFGWVVTSIISTYTIYTIIISILKTAGET